MFFKRVIWFFVLVAAAACGSRRPEPVTVLPAEAASKPEYELSVDRDIARIFGDPPIVGRLPKDPSWAPDSSQIAYIHMSSLLDAEPCPELWLHDLKGNRERPLVADRDMPVSDYAWCGKDKLVVSSKGDLVLVEITGKTNKLTETESAEESAECSPDGSKVAFVRDHDLFVLDTASGREIRITEGGQEAKSFGEVTWVYGEEFRTDKGFGWSPDGDRLWFYHTDVSEVTAKTVVVDSEGNTRLQPYPRPDEPNPKVRIGAVSLKSAKTEIAWMNAGDDADIYLPQITWHPNAKNLVIARLDRLQTILDLLLCDSATGSCEVIISERDPRWVNLLGPPKFLKDGREFLWLSERDGFSHIYRFGMDGRVKAQVTSGKWVVSSIDEVDEGQAAVYYTANIEKSTAYGLYRAEIEDGDPERISSDPGVHSASFSPDGKLFLDTHSALDRPPRTDICDASGEMKALLNRADLAEYHNRHVMNDLFPIETEDGEILNALLTRPAAIDSSSRYPVLIYVYGGPGGQVALDRFSPSYQPWRNLLAGRGILVFSVDGRGTAGRGREFEAAIHRRLGEVELKDQLAGVAYLKTLPFVDPERLAIFGWSYGGTMVLNALLRTKGIFKAGVAVAPVTDWRQYDTAYTERYMQRPSDNPQGYSDTSLITIADKLKTPLFLAHGLADDNVQFANSALLVDALIKAGKDFDAMFYPGKDHGIRGPDTRAHLFTRITRFIEEHI
jgi:dipeptidyl-peptidase-4